MSPLNVAMSVLIPKTQVTFKMENCPVGVNTVGQLYPDYVSDWKSRFWQFDNQPNPRSEVVCPQPHRASRAPYFINTLSKVSSKQKSILPMFKVDCAQEILDLIMNQDDADDDPDFNNQVGPFCGSPPLRTNNPVIHDLQFAKQAQSLASLSNSPGAKQTGTTERGSPNCDSSFGGSPKVRIEGFTCGCSPTSVFLRL